MIHCLAVDDETYATDMIADYIGKVPYLKLVGTTNNAIDALSLIQKGNIDLVFLDIQMPELTGLQFLNLCGNKCKVILTTAYAEYALDGFDHGVIDYLLKPIALDRFLKAAQKALQHIEGSKIMAVDQPAEISPVNHLYHEQPYLFIKGDSKSKFVKVNYADILYIQGLKNYVSIFTADQRFVTYQSLQQLEEQLPQPLFFRIHRSYIISVNKIRMVDGNTLYIGETGLPISESYKDKFLKLIRDR